MSVIEKLKKTEQVKLLALQAKERIVRLLEKSVELGRESILFKAAETRDKTALAELKTSHNEKVSPSISRTLFSI